MEKAKPMKQEIYESLSFDNNDLSLKVKGLEVTWKLTTLSNMDGEIVSFFTV
jgi:hypothetical protein